jgi:hypothetical protein
MRSKNSVLIAIWPSGRTPGLEPPWRILWEDRSPATLEDYRLHEGDTSVDRSTKEGTTIRSLYPDLVAHLHWDTWGCHWSLTGDGLEPLALWITDPSASNEQLRLAVSSLPIEYRVIIHRPE